MALNSIGKVIIASVMSGVALGVVEAESKSQEQVKKIKENIDTIISQSSKGRNKLLLSMLKEEKIGNPVQVADNRNKPYSTYENKNYKLGTSEHTELSPEDHELFNKYVKELGVDSHYLALELVKGRKEFIDNYMSYFEKYLPKRNFKELSTLATGSKKYKEYKAGKLDLTGKQIQEYSVMHDNLVSFQNMFQILLFENKKDIHFNKKDKKTVDVIKLPTKRFISLIYTLSFKDGPAVEEQKSLLRILNKYERKGLIVNEGIKYGIYGMKILAEQADWAREKFFTADITTVDKVKLARIKELQEKLKQGEDELKQGEDELKQGEDELKQGEDELKQLKERGKQLKERGKQLKERGKQLKAEGEVLRVIINSLKGLKSS